MNRKPITLAAMAIASMAMITLSSCNGNTQSNNGNDADSTEVVNENVEAPAVSDDEIKDFITTMYNDYLYGEEEFLREYCTDNGEFVRSTTDFYNALEQAGYKRKKTNTGNFIVGLSVKLDFLD